MTRPGAAALQGTQPEVEKYTYAQYAAAQKADVGSDSYQKAKSFFAQQLSGLEEASEILSDMPSHEDKGREAYLSEDVNAPDVARRCKELGITPASYFLAATYMAISAFTGKQKVYICTVSNGRGNLKTAGTTGMFVNTLALYGDVCHGTVEDYLKVVHASFSETLQHENYPFSQVASDFGFQPQIMLAYEVGVVENYAGMTSEVMETGYPKFPVSIFVDGEEGKERFVLAYDDKLFSQDLMRNLAKTLAAVAAGGKTWTYAEVDRITDRLASYIAGLGLGREDVVSVLIGRNQWMVLASLGILKAGCAYQPLDASYPQERLNFMIGDASAKLLIADEDLLPIMKDYHEPALKTADIMALKDGKLPEGPAPDSLFYILPAPRAFQRELCWSTAIW